MLAIKCTIKCQMHGALTEVVARVEQFVASGAGEAVQMIHAVPRPHHQLLGRDPQLTARATLHREPPVAQTEQEVSDW
jgi:hypothetical protein